MALSYPNPNTGGSLTQKEYKTLHKLLHKWADLFSAGPEKKDADEQPMYEEMIRNIARQVNREID